MSDTSHDERGLRFWLLAIVVVHFAIAIWHGAAHTHVPVPLTPLQSAFVLAVILALPFVGVGLLWTRYKRSAALLIAGSMLAALVFGIVNHFVLESPDNVLAVPEHAWRHSFVLSAVLVAVAETIGTVLGAIAMWRWWRA